MTNLWPWVHVIKHLFNDESVSILEAAPQILVGYSGGLDSTLLLHALASDARFSSKLQALHVHHGLSEHAGYWQQRCEAFCNQHGVPLKVHHAHLQRGPNLEEEARDVRYAAFAAALHAQGCLVLAHHRDDQAETVLLALCRGTGITGLVGMPQVRTFATGKLLRPFLHVERETLNHYAIEHELTWISDESNENTQYSRNYIRHDIMPLLRSRWPAVTRTILSGTKNCEQAQANLNDLAMIDSPDLVLKKDKLALSNLMHLSDSRIVNVLRTWLMNQAVRLPSSKKMEALVHTVIRAKADAAPSIQINNHIIRRYQSTLYCSEMIPTPVIFEDVIWSSFPESMLSGNGFLMANPVDEGICVPAGALVEIRYRKGGERIRLHGQTKSLKKMCQALGIPPWLRDKIPLIYIDGALALVLDYCVADGYVQKSGIQAYQICYRSEQHEKSI